MTILKRRLFSFSIDMLAIIIMRKLLLWNYFSGLKIFFPLNSSTHQKAMELYPFMGLSLFICLFFGYFIYCQYIFEGKTIGSVFFKLSIKSEDKSPIRFSQVLLRTIGSFFCYILGLILFLTPLLNKEQKGIQDYLSKTHVFFDEDEKSEFYNVNEAFEVQDWKESA